MFLVSFCAKCYNLVENTERIPYKVNKSNKSEVIHYDGKTQSKCVSRSNMFRAEMLHLSFMKKWAIWAKGGCLYVQTVATKPVNDKIEKALASLTITDAMKYLVVYQARAR